MTGLEIGFLTAQVAVDAAAIALSIFSFGLATPVATAMSVGFTSIGAMLPSIETISKGNLSIASIMSSIGAGLLSAIPGGGSALIGKVSSKLSSKTTVAATSKLGKFLNATKNKISKVNKFLDELAPDSILDNITAKLVKQNNKQTLVEDAQIIARKESELKTFGEVRTDKKINSTTFNKDTFSWVKSAHFEESKFIDRNNIQGTLTIFYYMDNDSRLGNRKRIPNGNEELRAIQIPGARYKNDYVSGICRAKSWGSYYMRTWMIGKPGRAAGINTLIFFGGEWRVDKKIKSLISQYKNPIGVLSNHSEKVAKHFLGKTKIGTKLMSFGDAYVKTTSLLGGNTKVLNPYLKSGLKKIKNRSK